MSIGACDASPYQDNFAEVDINGIYPDGPYQPFVGFGLVDPNRGQIMQQTNATWSKVVVTNIEAIVAKNLSHNFQVMTSVTRQWQQIDGTWNPTDPARFIQPDAFANNRDLSRHLFGNGDDNSLDGGGNESGVAYRPFRSVGGQWNAPGHQRRRQLRDPGGGYGTAPRQLPANDPQVTQFGPSTVRRRTGSRSQPIATRPRFQGRRAATARRGTTMRSTCS
jgi:hypothetical protein